jgi:hypothetical protein
VTAAVAVEEFAAITTLIQDDIDVFVARLFQGSRNSAPPISSKERAA